MKDDKPQLKYYTVPVLIEEKIFDIAVNYQTHVEGIEIRKKLGNDDFIKLINEFYSGTKMISDAEKDLWVAYRFSPSNTKKILEYLNLFKIYYVPLWWFNLFSTTVFPFRKRDE